MTQTNVSWQPTIKEDKRTPKQKCEESGGYWDGIRCINIKPEDVKRAPVKPTPPPLPTKLSPEQKAGANYITDRFGNEIIQTPEEAKAAKSEVLRLDARESGVGAAESLQLKQAQEAEQQRLMEIAGRIGQVGALTEAQQKDINWSQAMTAGTIGQAPSMLATIGGFAVGGAMVWGPAGAIAGAGVGVVAGVMRGVIGNIKEQQRGELASAKDELGAARTAMRQLAMFATQDPANADMYIQLYNNQLTRLHQARRQTQVEVAGDLNSWMEDGREQLSDFDVFLNQGGLAEIYGQKLKVALLTGTLTMEDVMLNEGLE